MKYNDAEWLYRKFALIGLRPCAPSDGFGALAPPEEVTDAAAAAAWLRDSFDGEVAAYRRSWSGSDGHRFRRTRDCFGFAGGDDRETVLAALFEVGHQLCGMASPALLMELVLDVVVPAVARIQGEEGELPPAHFLAQSVPLKED